MRQINADCTPCASKKHKSHKALTILVDIQEVFSSNLRGSIKKWSSTSDPKLDKSATTKKEASLGNNHVEIGMTGGYP